MVVRRLCIGAILAGTLSLAAAAELSGGGPASPPPAGQRSLASCGTVTLTQSTSQSVTAGSSISCAIAPGVHHDNSYYRAFSLGAFPSGFSVCALQFGIQEANAGDPATAQPLTVNIYANSGDAFPAGTRTLVGTASVSVSDQILTILDVPVAATVPAGAELVAEVFTPSALTDGHVFYIGSNAGGQSGPSYIKAASCHMNSPISLDALGYPDIHFLMNVLGDPLPTADLEVLKSNQRTGLLDGEWTQYTLIAANAGPDAVANAVLSDTLPATLVDGQWWCVQELSTGTCPVPASGTGDLSANFALASGKFLRFDMLARTQASGVAFVANKATLIGSGVYDADAADNEAIDEDAILSIAIFRDDFESVMRAQVLSVPEAAAAATVPVEH